MDCITLKGIRAYGYTGLLEEERVLGQWFAVDLTLWLDLTKAGQTDSIDDTCDYRDAIVRTQELIRQGRYLLVEALAEAIAQTALDLHFVEQVSVQLSKPAPPIPDFSGTITVDITRSFAGRAGQDSLG